MPIEHIFKLPFALWILLGTAGWMISYPLVLHQNPTIKRRRFLYLMVAYAVWLLVFGLGIEYDKTGSFDIKFFVIVGLILTFGLYSNFKASRCCGRCGKIVCWNPSVPPINVCPKCKAPLDNMHNLL